MLRDVTGLPMVDKACFLPFYSNAGTNPNTWVVGSIVLDSYYTVYDLTGDLSVGIAPKSPNFDPDIDTGGGGFSPENIRKHGGLRATIIMFVGIGCTTCGLIYKRKVKNEQDTVFETSN